MSIKSNQGPIEKIPHSQSNKSLFTENSQQSRDQLHEQPILSHEILQQQTKNQKKQEQKEQIDHVLDLPNKIPTLPFNTIPQHPNLAEGLYAVNDQRQNTPNNNTISMTKPPTENRNRYPYYDPHRITGLSYISKINQPNNERQKMLRSSQGGRWLRSQSLMNEKQKRSPQLMLKNFHRYQSKYGQLLDRHMRSYNQYDKQLRSNYSQYGISLNDTIEEIKNKMEVYLEKKVDLSNLPIDRPDADWKQEDLMKFYSNYQPILLKKLNMKQDGPQTLILKKYKNCVYYGSIKNSKKHGFGYLHYFSGRFFEGMFEDDQKIQGFQMDDSQLYLGKYKKNQRNGEGILKNDEHLIAGIFTNGQFSLPKEQTVQNKTLLHSPIMGKIQNEYKINKKGFKIDFQSVIFFIENNTAIFKNGINDLYIGQMNKENEKHGKGLEIFANGDVYIGHYEQGMPQGYGQYYWESGAFYRGQFLSGMRHGKGKWTMINGDKYEGDYLNDKKNGNGIYLWKSGDKYVGQFENDYRHGYGEMYWRDGTTYKGKWSNGIEVNKIIKLEDEKKNQRYSKVTQVKSSFKTIQPKKRGSALNHSHNLSHHKGKPIEEVGKRVPLQKLKAMLNPSNSVN